MKSAVRDPEMTKSGEIGQAYAFEWLEAAPDLAPYLNSFYILRVGAERVADTMPAYSGQLMITLRGEASMTFEAGRTVSAGAAGFMCPLTRAHQFELSPGTIIVGASLNFRGWASLTRLAVDENQDCYLPVERGLPLPLVCRAQELPKRFAREEVTEREALEVLVEVVRSGISPLPMRHSQVIDTTLEWISSSLKPDIEILRERLCYSERQMQRLVARFFGQPPVRLIRRYRAIRSATLLSMPDLSAALEQEVFDAFYDQAHMIKEIRHFTGRTPKRLQPRAASIITETLAEPGYGSVDLFGGHEQVRRQKS